MARPGPHPRPPANFNERKLSFQRVRKGAVWHRFHNANRSALFFGTTGDNRFDDPRRKYGVLYVAQNLDGAFVETFLRDLGPYRSLSPESIEQKVLSIIKARRGLRLVDLADIGLARMGMDNRISTGDYKVAQEWSRAFHDHPDKPDGILYRSRHYPRELCAALYPRARDALTATNLGTLRQYLGEEEMYALLARYGVGEI